MIRVLLIGVIVWGGFVYAGGEAVDHELARAGVLLEREVNPEGGAGQAQRWSGTGWRQVAETPEAETDFGLITEGRKVVGASRSKSTSAASNDRLREPARGARIVPPAGLTDPSRRPLTTEPASLTEPSSTLVPPQQLRRTARKLQYGSSVGRQASIRAIRQVFGRRAAAALRVSSCETGGTFNARALGRHGERGLFQLHPVHRGWIDRLYGWARMFEPLPNARAAYRLSRGGTSWRAWTCQP